ncbi:MAG: hypothetical protein U1U88_000748 [Lawsonella clevelandensis]
MMNRYSSVGTVVWTRLESMAQCATLSPPTWWSACGQIPQHHVERYTGVLHRHGDERHIRCVADRPQ